MGLIVLVLVAMGAAIFYQWNSGTLNVLRALGSCYYALAVVSILIFLLGWR